MNEEATREELIKEAIEIITNGEWEYIKIALETALKVT